MVNDAIEERRTGSLGERRSRRRLVGPDGQAPYDEDERQRFFSLGPGDLAFVASTRSERNRLALALLLTWARAERKLVSDPAALPTDVVTFVAGQLGLTPMSWPAIAADRPPALPTLPRSVGSWASERS